MTFSRAVALVARRELSERARERSFAISTAVSLVILLGVLVVPQIAGFWDEDSPRVGLAGAQAPALREAFERQGDDGITVRVFASAGAGERALEEGDVDALVVDGRTILVEEELEADLAVRIQAASRDVRARAALARAGVAPERADDILEPPPLPTRALDGQDGGGEGLALVAVIILYGQLFGYGFWVASGVVEEKASRVVEILLATVTSRELLAGKVLGIGVLGLLQLFLMAVAGVAGAVAVDVLDLSGDVLWTILVTLVWFVLGYAFYAWLFAAAGSTISRVEELQNVVTPLSVVILASFLLSFAVIGEPDGTLAAVASVVPPISAMVMPPRIAAGDVAGWQVSLAAALLVAATAAVVPLAARLYGGAVLKTGGRVRLREAWRGERA